MEMQKAAEDLDFEKAIELRDQLLDVQRSIGARKTGAKKAAGRKAEKRGKKESE